MAFSWVIEPVLIFVRHEVLLLALVAALGFVAEFLGHVMRGRAFRGVFHMGYHAHVPLLFFSFGWHKSEKVNLPGVVFLPSLSPRLRFHAGRSHLDFAYRARLSPGVGPGQGPLDGGLLLNGNFLFLERRVGGYGDGGWGHGVVSRAVSGSGNG